MSLRYLPELAPVARLTLELAEKEAAHLAYTAHTLFAQRVDLPWVQQLAEAPELAEKVDAFVARFARLQDHIGERLLPRFSALVGEAPKSMLDVLAFAERMGWVDQAEAFVGARKLRNLLVHEYLNSPELFLDALLAARQTTESLLRTVTGLRAYAQELGLYE